MPTIEPILPGLYARSETLVEATRDHDRERIDDATLAEEQRRDLEAVVGAQATSGFATVSTGQLTWHDIFRPFTAFVEGLAPRTLVRFLDTNTFYRRPDIEGAPVLARDRLGATLDAHLPTPGPLPGLATLPSPTAFVTAARDEDGRWPDVEVAASVGRAVYPALLGACAQRNFRTVVLHDPWLAHHPEPDALVATLGEALAGGQDPRPRVLFQVPFADAGPLVESLADAPVDGVVADLTLTDIDALTALDNDQTVGLGLVDARSSLVERADRLVGTVQRACDTLSCNEVFLAPTGDLQHVPEPIARRKVRVLGELAHLARAKLGGDA